MEDSVLTSTKKILGLDVDYTAFDQDIINFINSAFSVLDQLGVILPEDFVVENTEAKWADLELASNQLSMVRTYIYLKVRMLFDPPTTSFLIEAVNKQIDEHEYRISVNREWGLDPNDPMLEIVEEVEL